MIKEVWAGPAVQHKGTYQIAPQLDLQTAYGLNQSHIQTQSAPS